MSTFTQKWGKKIGVAVVVMFAAKGFGYVMGKSLWESNHANAATVASDAPKTVEDAYARGGKIMDAAMNAPASEFCKGQAQDSYNELVKTVTITDPAAVIDYLAKSCTGGSDTARIMRTEWGYNGEQINKAAADLSAQIPNIAVKFEGEGIDKTVTLPLAREFVHVIQAGYEIEALKAH